MKAFLIVITLFSVRLLLAQADVRNILNRDSFAPNVKNVTVNCYLHNSDRDTNEFQSSRYYECDSTGKWVIRIETYSDSDVSHDTVKYDARTRTRVIVRANDFEPSKGTTVFNKDGTIKSYLAEPGQRDAQLTEYEYDQNRRVIKKTVTFVENLTVEIYAYDKEGRLVNVKRSSGSVTSKKLQLDYEERYEYSGSDASLMYGLHYGANELVRVRDTVACTYDENRRLTSKVEVMENGTWRKITTFEYDMVGREIMSQWEYTSKRDGEVLTGHKNMEYDSLGYYTLYVEEETSYGFSNRWTTEYNEFGLPVQCFYHTAAETFYYEWKYEFR